MIYTDCEGGGLLVMNKRLTKLILTAVALGMGVSVFVLSILDNITTSSAISLLSIGVLCLAILNLQVK